ncbi:MAG: hypothetical protein DWG81_02555 [Chloroflexi bacterium]|nr:hypothetical protein [Chloroflexota bacterium]
MSAGWLLFYASLLLIPGVRLRLRQPVRVPATLQTPPGRQRSAIKGVHRTGRPISYFVPL